jgi:[NiFe] hydrogenase small subunit
VHFHSCSEAGFDNHDFPEKLWSCRLSKRQPAFNQKLKEVYRMEQDEKFDEKLEKKIEELVTKKGVTRRDFMKFCGLMAATLGLEHSMLPKIAEALTSGQRPPVVWLQFAECTGCTEALLRISNPLISDILLTSISLEYHETIMAPAGASATLSLDNAVANYPGEFFAFVEGAIPTANNGQYGMIGGQTMLSIAQSVLPKAKKVIAVGTCGSYGGLAAAAGGFTGAKGVKDATGISTINMPGCPPNAINLAALIVNYLLTGTDPALDGSDRPTFAYGSTNHTQCPRRGTQWCLLNYGCKGPGAHHNCPSVKYNDGQSFCMNADAPCKECTEQGFWDAGNFFDYSGSYKRKW